MKNLAIGIVLMLVAVLGVVACQPSQAADEPTATGPAATQPVATEPVATEPVVTDSVTTEPLPTEPDVMPEGPDYTSATPPSISDLLGGGGLAIVYERSGGFAGVMEKAEIYGDGRLAWSEDGQVTELRAPVARVEALRALIDAIDWAELAGSAPSSLGGQGADRFAYTLTVVREGKPLQVSWTEGQSGLPAGLQEVVAAIQALIQNAN